MIGSVSWADGVIQTTFGQPFDAAHPVASLGADSRARGEFGHFLTATTILRVFLFERDGV